MAIDITRSGSNVVITSDGATYKTYGVDDLISHEVVNGRLRLLFADGQFYDLDATDLSIQGAPFTGTAAQLRDKLAGEVFVTGINALQITQAAYDALATKDANTLYLIV